MKLRAWMNILVSIIMLIISGYLLADSSVMSLDLLSNPNLNVAIELIRLLWGIVGIIYFLYYLYHGIYMIRFAPVGNVTENVKSRKATRRGRGRKRRSKNK